MHAHIAGNLSCQIAPVKERLGSLRANAAGPAQLSRTSSAIVATCNEPEPNDACVLSTQQTLEVSTLQSMLQQGRCDS